MTEKVEELLQEYEKLLDKKYGFKETIAKMKAREQLKTNKIL